MATSEHWIIVSDEGTATKPKKHLSFDSAYEESIRLSKLKPGINFAVYKLEGTAFTPKPVKQKTTFTRVQPVVPTFSSWTRLSCW